MLKFNHRISNIPCQIEVLYYEPPCSGRRGHPDNWEPDTPEYIEYDVLDRSGRRAPWLEKKMTNEDYAAVHTAAIQHMKEDV